MEVMKKSRYSSGGHRASSTLLTQLRGAGCEKPKHSPWMRARCRTLDRRDHVRCFVGGANIRFRVFRVAMRSPAASLSQASSSAPRCRLIHASVNHCESHEARINLDARGLGIYKLTRNPMYLGFILALLGWAVVPSNPLAFFFLPAFMLYMNGFQIASEERALAALLDETFTAYKSRV